MGLGLRSSPLQPIWQGTKKKGLRRGLTSPSILSRKVKLVNPLRIMLILVLGKMKVNNAFIIIGRVIISLQQWTSKPLILRG